jgi:type II secretory pathway predicted ATPase ExeA
VLNELRLLASTQFDSRIILSVVLAGDNRLLDRLRRDELMPLGSRIRYRLTLSPASHDQLRACLQHLMDSAGNSSLMTAPLVDTLCEHALGNYRVLTTMAAELLAAGAQRDYPQLDEKLYFEVFQTPPAALAKRRRRGAA